MTKRKTQKLLKIFANTVITSMSKTTTYIFWKYVQNISWHLIFLKLHNEIHNNGSFKKS